MSDDGTDAGAGPLLELQGLLRREDDNEVTLKLRPVDAILAMSWPAES